MTDLKTSIVFDMILSDPITININIYNLWLLGYNINDSYIRYKNSVLLRYKLKNVVVNNKLVVRLNNCILKDIEDEYRCYNILELYFINININDNIKDDIILQMSNVLKYYLIDKYYSFDNIFIRYLISKKLILKDRKELNYISDLINSNLISCNRQFDNFKRIKDFIELDATIYTKAELLNKISTSFCLSTELASSYCRLLFLNLYRFDTFNGRLNNIPYIEFEKYASILFAWTDTDDKTPLSLTKYLKKLSEYFFDSTQIDIIRNNFLEICPTDGEVSVATFSFPFSFAVDMNIGDTYESDREDDGKDEATVNVIRCEKLNKIGGRFTYLAKLLINLATSLHKGKEIRSLFLRILELTIMLSKFELYSGEVEILFEFLVKAWSKVMENKDIDYIENWSTYLQTVGEISCLMFRSRFKPAV